MSNSSICPIYRTLWVATTPGQSGPGSDGNEGLLHILQNPSITEALPSDCLVSYQGHSLGESYPSTEMQSMYFGPEAPPTRKLKIKLKIFLFLFFYLLFSKYISSKTKQINCIKHFRSWCLFLNMKMAVCTIYWNGALNELVFNGNECEWRDAFLHY